MSRQKAVTMIAAGDLKESSGDLINRAYTLHTASYFGQVGMVKEILKRPGVEVDFVDPRAANRTPLHVACGSGHLETIKILLEHCANIHILDRYGYTPFHRAARMGHLEVVIYLENKIADIDRVNPDGHNALHVSAAGNSITILEYLLNSDNFSHSLLEKTAEGETALFWAVRAGSLEAAQFILKQQHSTDILAKTDYGETYLHAAVKSGKSEMLTMFADSSISHHAQTREGYTALHYAVRTDQSHVFHTLLDHIDSTVSSARDPFSGPVIINNISNLQKENGAWCCEHVAYGYGYNQTLPSGNTALHDIVVALPFSKGRILMLKDLTSRVGVDLECVDRMGRTPMAILALRILETPEDENLQLALKHLLSKGANLNTQDFQGKTPLHNLCYVKPFNTYIYETFKDILGIQTWFCNGSLGFQSGLPIHQRQTAKPPLMTSNHNSKVARVDDIFDYQNESVIQAFFRNMHTMGRDHQETTIALRMLELSSENHLMDTLPNGSRLLNLAIIQKNDRIIGSLIARGISTEDRDSTPQSRSPLELFCIHGARDIELFRSVSSSYQNLGQLDKKGWSPLHLARQNGHDNVVEELLQRNVDINAICGVEKALPLEVAIKYGHKNIAEMLFEKGAGGERGTMWLDVAPNAKMCRYLEDRGLSDWEARGLLWVESTYVPFFSTKAPGTKPNSFLSRTVTQTTPLHRQVYSGKLEVFEYIAEHHKDVDFDIKAELRITPLFYAILSRNHDVVRFLLAHGADSNNKFVLNGWTNLHLAAYIGDKVTVSVLLSYGADASVLDASHLTPSILALQQNHRELSDTLHKAESIQGELSYVLSPITNLLTHN
jgi:ankyrin repeat protein